MAEKLNLILIFVALLVLDGIFLPAVFGFKESLAVFIFILAMILNWKVSSFVLWFGFGFSFFLEFFWKLQPGSLLFLFLAVALIYLLTSSLLAIKRYVGALILSFCLWFWFWNNGFMTVVTSFSVFALCFFLFDHVVKIKNSPVKFNG
ncbi:MAG: hypothetical protein COV30_01740 [Candidatus Yanofskybacteria bacterium CG10_big_fil_rev_8_21_14_0_10_37_15]|uniref:Uncharacterized protein n=1 Tax=Candidatus Yanofskybacteria bacterium CG10_big_fil_rev_8_21_14_0_10_37_15 TaxID=1975097 RepID=A0A2H0R788_9BACT|nr:MAG: hypothetical protein COV30_01740 [Candidatus Yanofskybacteria bacterium CG10_big_fil_rev_8_21_14_0_10_37_15]